LCDVLDDVAESDAYCCRGFSRVDLRCDGRLSELGPLEPEANPLSHAID
jgi:hypothetical protein